MTGLLDYGMQLLGKNWLTTLATNEKSSAHPFHRTERRSLQPRGTRQEEFGILIPVSSFAHLPGTKDSLSARCSHLTARCNGRRVNSHDDIRWSWRSQVVISLGRTGRDCYVDTNGQRSPPQTRINDGDCAITFVADFCSGERKLVRIQGRGACDQLS